MPTTDPPSSIATITRSIRYPSNDAASIQSHVPLTPAQMGQTLNGKNLFTIHTAQVMASIEITVRIIMASEKEDTDAQHHHSNSAPHPHVFCFCFSPRVYFFKERAVA